MRDKWERGVGEGVREERRVGRDRIKGWREVGNGRAKGEQRIVLKEKRSVGESNKGEGEKKKEICEEEKKM